MERSRVPLVLFGFLFASLVAGLAIRTTADPDLWGHVRFGSDTIATRSLIPRDTYSFTSDVEWTNHEWLAEVIMAQVYEAAGTRGLVALSSGVALVVLLLVGSHLRRAEAGEPVTLALLGATFAGMAPQLTVVRPQLFSVLLFTLTLIILDAAERGQQRQLLWLGPVFTLWTNLHGGWVVGLGAVGLWAITALATRRLSPGWAAVTSVVVVTASLLNPYGWRLWQFLWETVGLAREDIDDWQSLLSHPSGFLQWFAGAGVVLVAWRRGHRAAAFRYVLPVALGLLAVKVVRLDAFFLLAVVVILGPVFAGVGPAFLRLSRQPLLAESCVVLGLACAGFSFVGYQAWTAAGCLPLESKPLMPEAESVAFFTANRIHGRLLTWFDYGEYAIWHLAPTLRVSYDGRRETVYSNRVKGGHLEFYAGLSPAYPDKIGADYVWLPKWPLPVKSLSERGWVRVFEGERSVILVRTLGSYVQPEPFKGPRCFPGP